MSIFLKIIISYLTKIQLNKVANYICFCKRKNYLGNILLTEGMKLIVEKLDIQNLFKKIYKDVPDIEEQNSEYESIEMSDLCKNDLRNILSKQDRSSIKRSSQTIP